MELAQLNFTWGEEAENTPSHLSCKRPLPLPLPSSILEQTSSQAEKLSVDGVTLVKNAITQETCGWLLQCCGLFGFSSHDELSELGKALLADAQQRGELLIWPQCNSIRTSGRLVWQVPDVLRDALASKIENYLPQELHDEHGKTWRYHSINARFRFHRYEPGQQFHTHYDSACAHVRNGAQLRSFLSLVFYLNDDYDGGHTTFFKSRDSEGTAVLAERGSCLIFAHQGSPQNALHGGSPVKRGCKFILRTDAMYLHIA
jgi:prolyl 4-hydroxylase